MKLKKLISILLLLSMIIIDAYACGPNGQRWGHRDDDWRRRWCPECPNQQPCPASVSCPASGAVHGSGSSDGCRFNACPCSGAFPIDSIVASDGSKIGIKVRVPKLELSRSGFDGWFKFTDNV